MGATAKTGAGSAVEGARVLTYEILRHAGTIMRHVVGVLILCWRRVLRATAVAGATGFLLAEVAGVVTTRSLPPSALTHVAALVLAAGLAYAAAITLVVDELLKGAIATVRVAEGDVRAGAEALAVLAEREAGAAGSGITRWLGQRRKTGTAATGIAQAQIDGDDSARHDGVTAETLADIAATEEFANTAPHPRVNARPVRADQFPRITWAAEDVENSGVHMAVRPSPVASAPMPSLPMRGDTGQASSPRTSEPPDPSLAQARTVPVTTKPLAGDHVDGEVWMPPSTPPVAQSSDTQAQDTKLSRPQSRSLPRREDGGGVWSRIGQALVGKTPPKPAKESTSVEAPVEAPEASGDAPTP